MKTIRLLSVLVFAAAMLAGPAWAADEKKPCCEATVEAGKKCDHACCKKAAEANKVCKKCHPPKKGQEKK